MKQSVNRKAGYAGIALIILALSAMLSSCSQGIFNFNEETGNISISFFADSSVSINFNRVVFSLTNNETNAFIREEREVYYDYGGQASDCYISRADAGSWNMLTSLYDYDGNLIAEREDYFELSLAQTVIAEVEYYSTGDMSVVWEKPVGSDPESLLGAERLTTLVVAYHTAGDTIDLTQYQTTMIAEGTGFDTAMSSMYVTFPDNGYFAYDGGWARAVSNVSVDTSSEMLSVTREDYNSPGNYSLQISDINGVETELYDYCDFPFDPNYGLATLNGTYTASATITDTQYDKNDSASAGTYIAYTVDTADGTVIGGTQLTVFEDPVSETNLNMLGNLANGILVLCTIDADLTQTDIDSIYNGSAVPALTPDVWPDKLPLLLYEAFGDRINYIGMSVQVY